MRKEMPQYGDKRIIKKFLLLPKTIDYERRWLENAEIEQYFDRYARMWKSYKWVNQ